MAGDEPRNTYKYVHYNVKKDRECLCMASIAYNSIHIHTQQCTMIIFTLFQHIIVSHELSMMDS